VASPEDRNSYLAIPLRELNLTRVSPRTEYPRRDLHRELLNSLDPWATVDGGEAYVDFATPGEPILVLRTTRRGEVSGQLFLSSESANGTVRLAFTATEPTLVGDARESFYRAKRTHYQKRLETCSAGRAWFRHQVRMAESRLPREKRPESAPLSTRQPNGDHQLMKWFAMFTGGRAIAENLSLQPYRTFATGSANVIRVDLIRGVNVPAFDWRRVSPKNQPVLDPLAACLPADQHAVFFPSVQQAYEIAEQATGSETVFLRLADPRTEHWRIRERYEQQFGIPLAELVALLGADLARSVALTGSDPHVAMGTDVAIVIESPKPAMLAQRLAERIGAGASRSAEVESRLWKSQVLTAIGVCSADRRICSYVAALPQAVVLTNSVYQLQQLSDVQTGSRPSLAAVPEMAFFRDRYRRGDSDETALVVISDATIRRWGSPRWRIGQARRLTAAAALAEWQADWLDRRTAASDPTRERAQATDPMLPDDLEISARGVYSRTYGSLEFMTPVSELPLNWVTAAERAAYETWRNGYQRSWVRFDPIAMRLGLHDRRLDVDVTVMPLTIRTEYARFRSLTQGAQLRADGGDPHDSYAELAVAFNKDSEFFRLMRLLASPYFSRSERSDGIDPLAWFDGMVTVYLDEDLAWEEVAKQGLRRGLLKTLSDEQLAILAQVPVGIQVEVTSGLELTKFLVALRVVVESSAPGMLKWELCEHRGEPYAKVSAGEIAKDRHQGEAIPFAREFESAALYYAASGDALIISPNENVLRRALDRRIARRSGPDEPIPPEPRQRLGDNVAVHVDAKLLRLLADLAGEDRYQRFMQTRSWSNLAILNEWKRLYPDEDPVVVHERLWHVKPVCPGGGDYVWNRTWQTMESTVYGHPAAPKTGPALPEVFRRLLSADAGLTFEANGLRARFSLALTAPAIDAGPTSTSNLTHRDQSVR
jgi:hypothetical protein